MDDRQLINIYSDPTLSPGQKLQMIQSGGSPSVFTGSGGPELAPTAPTTNIGGMSPIVSGGPSAGPGPNILSTEPAIPGVTGVMGGVAGESAGKAAVQGDLNKIRQQKAAPAPTGPIMVPETTVTPGPAARGGGKSKPPGGTPDWLRKYMAPEAEGKVRPPPVGYTVKPLSDEGLAALNQSDTEGFAAKRTQGEAEIQSAQDIAHAAVKAAEDQDAVNAAFAEREHQRQEQIRGMEANYRDMADNLANTSITEPSMWGGEDVGSQLLGRVALFLGTLGSGASGQPNLVWEKMQRDIDRNLQVQKENKALKASRLAAEGSLIDMARQRFQSESAVDQVMRQSAYEKLRAQLNAYAEEAKTPERKAALDALMAEVDKSLTVEDEQRRAIMQQAELNERMMRARANARPDPLAALVKRSGQLATIAKNERDIQGKPPAGELQDVPLWGVQVPKNVAPEAVKASAAYKAIFSELAKYKQRKTGESGTEASQNRLTILLKKGAGPGFSSDADMKLLADQVPDPSNPNFDKRMQELEQSLKAQERADMESVGAAPAFTPKTEKK